MKLHLHGSMGPSLRIIAVHDPEGPKQSTLLKVPLPLERAVYETIVRLFEISPLFLSAALNDDAVFLKV
jgi:hypothetical protein